MVLDYQMVLSRQLAQMAAPPARATQPGAASPGALAAASAAASGCRALGDDLFRDAGLGRGDRPLMELPLERDRAVAALLAAQIPVASTCARLQAPAAVAMPVPQIRAAQMRSPCRARRRWR